MDKIFRYRLDLAAGSLTLHGVTDLPPESGPRHFVFHPSGDYAYVICELSSKVIAMTFDSATDELTPVQSVPTLPADFDGESHCADIHVTASGKFLYAANRGHDTLAIFAIDETTGALTPIGHQSTASSQYVGATCDALTIRIQLTSVFPVSASHAPRFIEMIQSTQGKTPRNFAIDPTDTFLLAANQDSDTIVTFRIDQESGRLTATGDVAAVPTPVCLKFLQL